MAEKGFGVKEINLIGASGTPTIESPNNLNLNAVNVAISTNVSIGGTLSVTGNVSVGGTLTYEDVTNIDSVGVITARDSIKVGTGVTIKSNGDLFVGGQTILTGIVTTKNSVLIEGGSVNVDIGSLNQGFYLLNGSSSHLKLYWSSSASSNYFSGTGSHGLIINDFSGISIAPSSGACSLGYGGSGKLSTTSTGVSVTGTLAATAVTGDGSGLSNLPAATPTNSDIQVVYTVTANGASAYRFEGNGVVSSADNPDIYLIRGQKYRFINNSGGSHPFRIQSDTSSTLYSTGVTNNNANSGNIDFAPTYDSPAHLYYKCGSHPSMLGNIYLRDAAGGNINVGVTTIKANNVIGLNVENSSGGGAQTTIRSKSTVANASNFVRSESSDNKYIGLLKYGTGHSAYGALAAGGGAVYANSSVPITIMSDGSYINFATGGNTARLRIHADGKVTIADGTRTEETSTGGLLIDKDITAESDVSDKNNYHLVVRSQTNSNTSKIGIAFANTSNDEHVGAAILHHRETTDSVGSLVFYTSPSAGTTTERMKIDRNGVVTKPQHPVFSGRTNVQNSIVSGTGTIQFTADVNNGSHWSNSNYEFTCPVAGFYYMASSTLHNGETYIHYQKQPSGGSYSNISSHSFAYTPGSLSYNQISTMHVEQCNAGDKLRFQVTGSGANYYGKDHGSATIFLIG